MLFWCAIQLSVCSKCWAEVTPSCRGDPYYNEPRNAVAAQLPRPEFLGMVGMVRLGCIQILLRQL